MDLSEIVSITSMPGLFKVSAKRTDGFIVTSLSDDKTQFVSGRNHFFSTLDNITIFTTEDSIPLKDVLASIKKNEGTVTMPNSTNEGELQSWMAKILPNYDKEKVHVSDMKKLAKWYGILNDKKLIEELTTEKPKDENAETGAETTIKKDFTKKTESKHIVSKADLTSKSSSRPAPIKKITTPRKAS